MQVNGGLTESEQDEQQLGIYQAERIGVGHRHQACLHTLDVFLLADTNRQAGAMDRKTGKSCHSALDQRLVWDSHEQIIEGAKFVWLNIV